MCGFVGIVHKSSERVEESHLKKMTELLAHRGPDSMGLWTRNNIGLGHRRLKIIDLSDGSNQPFLSSDGQVALVFNGEIYNFSELRKELEAQGRSFRTKGDTEVLLQSYLQWGEKAFSKFNGIFSFGLVDLRENRTKVLLCRDRFGTKPLFYAYSDRGLAFASEIKPLLQISWISKEVDRSALLDFTHYDHVPCPKSIFSAIQQIPPGQYLESNLSGIRMVPYYDMIGAFQSHSALIQDEDDAIAELDQVMRRVMKRQTISDVPTGLFLSGGIDSSLLAVYGSEAISGGWKSYCVEYSESDFDESPYSSVVASRLGISHRNISVKTDDFMDLVLGVPKYFDQPMSDPTILPMLKLVEESKKDVSVAISGDGGDELFFGYLYQSLAKRLFGLTRLPKTVRKIAFGSTAKAIKALWPAMRYSIKFRQLSKFLDVLDFENETEYFETFIGAFGPLSPKRLRTLLRHPVENDVYRELIQESNTLDLDRKIENIFIHSFLLDTVLAKSDRCGMAHSLEIRVPFLDNELFEFSQKLSNRLKFKNGTNKYILRRLAERRLPKEISSRPKKGFPIPLEKWLRGDLSYLIEEYLNEKRVARSGYFDVKEVTSLKSEFKSGRYNHSQILWSMISFEIWKDEYL